MKILELVGIGKEKRKSGTVKWRRSLRTGRLKKLVFIDGEWFESETSLEAC